MSKIYHQFITDGRKYNVAAYSGIFSSISEINRFPMIIKNVSIFEMLKNHILVLDGCKVSPIIACL